jgi:hypothetical protein
MTSSRTLYFGKKQPKISGLGGAVLSSTRPTILAQLSWTGHWHRSTFDKPGRLKLNGPTTGGPGPRRLQTRIAEARPEY